MDENKEIVSFQVYSGAGNMVNELKQMMQQAQDERTRREFENFIQKIETM